MVIKDHECACRGCDLPVVTSSIHGKMCHHQTVHHQWQMQCHESGTLLASSTHPRRTTRCQCSLPAMINAADSMRDWGGGQDQLIPGMLFESDSASVIDMTRIGSRRGEPRQGSQWSITWGCCPGTRIHRLCRPGPSPPTRCPSSSSAAGWPTQSQWCGPPWHLPAAALHPGHAHPG